MPTITSLVLTMSRDSNGVVAAQVDYTLEFTGAEAMANVEFEETALLLRRVGARDPVSEQALPTDQRGTKLVITTAPGDTSDELVATLFKITQQPGPLGVPPTPRGGQFQRTYKSVLSEDELSKLLETGREHPYILVTVVPTDIRPDLQLAQVEIDVGDPGETPIA